MRPVPLGKWDPPGQIRDHGPLSLGGLGVSVYAVAFSPDGRLVATGTNQPDGYIKLWNAETGRFIPRTFRGVGADRFAREHTDAVLSISFSKDGKRLLTSSCDRTARLWDVETGR